ncbi:YciI family protein [Luteipulveratus mongoliensis]|uniref:YciI family protein n=1 Tax=Luteipulveratus mongoliensis TaxID=571913 RepID=UPI000696DE2F|nr:YciI family protein [Luteipulveratus mongoliensis]
MQVLVHGTDGPRFEQGESDVHEAHQAYMDGFSEAFLGRGPILSADGERHLGSVHVVTVDGPEAAHAFAFDEPYARAGWYSNVTVLPLAPCVSGTMWDRPRPAPEQVSAFVSASWQVEDYESSWVDRVRDLIEGDESAPWLFGGLLLGDEDPYVLGLAAAVDLAPEDAERQFRRLVGRLDVTSPHVMARRWQRGGRDSD